jgi:hypothetical protein
MRTNIPYFFFRLLLTTVIVTLAACGGGGSGGSGGGGGGGEGGEGPNTVTDSAPVEPDEPVTATDIGFVGNAVKSAVNNAEVVLVYFDEDGREVEIRASNAPVKTGVNGRFIFQAPLYDLPPNLGPGILRTEGGTTGADRGLAPRLETVIPDISAISNSSNILSHLTAASSVAAQLLSTEARTTGASPTVEMAKEILDRVETQLLVDLSQDPTLVTTAVAQFNAAIDALLSLRESSINNSSVNELVSYLAANLSSSSLQLDDLMQNPTNPGFDVEASLRVFGSGALSALFPAGPEQLLYMRIESDRARIANDGFEVATLAVSIRDLLGATIPTSSAEAVEFTIIEGQGSLTAAKLTADNDQVTVGLTSIAAGVVLVEASYTMPSGLHLTQLVDIEVLDEVVDSIGPTIISALATDNTEVIVTFSEALMGGVTGAENPHFYTITASDGTGQSITSSSVVGVLSATLISPDNSSVRLITQSQSDIDYILQTTNLRDVAGNTFLPPDNGFGAVNPSATIFVGMGPSGSEIVDSDRDGLSDSDELRGWTVTITSATGEITSYSVTSDPNNADTDGDGVTDNEEKHGALDPRTSDTDGDTLTDDQEWNIIFSDGTKQDTDGDGVQDGFEYKTFRTSPILADTDGDQMSDPDEVSAGNRNPLVADLPSPTITVGNIALALDTRFTYTDQGTVTELETKTSESTLVSGEDETFATSNEQSTKDLLEASQEISVTGSTVATGIPAVSVTGKVGSKQGSEKGNTFSASEESGRSSEEAYHDSLTTSKETSVTETVSREIVKASMKVSVSIESAGDIPFRISNMELSAEAQNPSKRSEMIPIASLVPTSDLEPLSDKLAVNIGTLGNTARGPFVFEAVDVFPQQVEELMKNPRGLIVSLANFDITDERGRNYSFISQEVLDRTVGLTFDMGDGRVENYRVATASAHNPANGSPLGITMSYALSIIGLQRYPYIIDGGNGVIDSVASANDETAAATGDRVQPGQVIITAGVDGVLDTSPSGDDRIQEPDYETFLQDEFAQIVDGGNGVVDTEADFSDVQVVDHVTQAYGEFTNRVDARATLVTEGGDGDLATEPNHLDEGLTVGDDRRKVTPERRLLKRFRDLDANGEESRFWVLFTPYDRPGVDMDDLYLRAGEQYNFAFVQDRDGDDVFARVEYLHGSSDRQVNSDVCNSSNSSDPTTQAYWARTDDCDYLTDFQEITDGWRVNLRGTLKDYLVYPNPVQGDSDRDGLSDDQEKLCGLDPRQRDTDLDGLTDWEELTGRLIELGSGGAANDNMVSRLARDLSVVQHVSVYAGETYIDDNDTPGIPGDDTVLANHEVMPRCYSLHSDPNGSSFGIALGFATDPLKFDTDGDQIGDGLELRLGLDPNDRRDGAGFLDDDGDGIPNSQELEGYDTWVNGLPTRFTSSPINSDSDDDGLPDLLERLLGSNPNQSATVTKGGITIGDGGDDTDGDGISDLNEYKSGGLACVNDIGGSQPCISFNRAGGWQDFLVQCAAAKECDPADVTTTLNARGSFEYGTNISHEDSDGDGLTDPEELEGWDIEVNGGPITRVYPDPLLADKDGDNWNDSIEMAKLTHPDDFDTDGDGPGTLGDKAESELGRDPTHSDRKVSLVYYHIGIPALVDCASGVEDEDFKASGTFSFDAGQGQSAMSVSWTVSERTFDNDAAHTTQVSSGGPITRVIPFGNTYTVSGSITNTDGADEVVTSWDITDEIDADLKSKALTHTGTTCSPSPSAHGYLTVQ